ncbi:DUF488 family protein [Glaciibacter flavus]|uniref:DUF488 family protein n=1 Tax=Orlajensenia flava TaxID=2565934 RepID=A0A4S4FZK7_9MICO|nr:DUF488 family protein [Glaciibacter flavus]THG35525.1 DUF488 family protein [Glaciibacter flavus]
MGAVIKRVYDEASEADGFRVLVDRLWPRGVSRDRAAIDLWLKDVAPSPDLRIRWHVGSEGWDDFVEDYRGELASNPAVDELRMLHVEHPLLTLVYASRDTERNHAVILQEFLDRSEGAPRTVADDNSESSVDQQA